MVRILSATCICSLLLTGLSSCFGSKPVQYFKGEIDTARTQQYRLPDPVIEKGDLLNIVIYSDNPEATLIFNQAGTSGSNFSKQGGVEGIRSEASAKDLATSYLVDNAGRIRMHAIGEILVEGMTRQQLEQAVIKRISDLGVLMNPYCAVRFANFKITVLGEVTRPGTYSVPVEKVTILEAMSMAGEVTNAGRRDRITLVRETMGTRAFAKLSLSDPGIFESPYFYLKQNDVLIVDADNRKITPSDQQTFQYLNLAFSLASILIVLVTSVFR